MWSVPWLTPERAAMVIWYTIAFTAAAFVYPAVSVAESALTPVGVTALAMVLAPTIALGGFVLGVVLTHRINTR